jgi:hypothetical protein
VQLEQWEENQKSEMSQKIRVLQEGYESRRFWVNSGSSSPSSLSFSFFIFISSVLGKLSNFVEFLVFHLWNEMNLFYPSHRLQMNNVENIYRINIFLYQLFYKIDYVVII